MLLKAAYVVWKENKVTDQQTHTPRTYDHEDDYIQKKAPGIQHVCISVFLFYIYRELYVCSLTTKMPLICRKCSLPSGNYDISKWILCTYTLARHVFKCVSTKHSETVDFQTYINAYGKYIFSVADGPSIHPQWRCWQRW